MNAPQPVVVEAPAVDGRAARSAKTRDAIADALLDLLADGRLRPTAREIAERAAVSVRSVYVHFDDLEDLFCVAAKRHFARVAPMLGPAPATGALSERADALVRQRIRLYAQAGAVARATRLHAAFSPTLARILREAQARSRADLERLFAKELHTLSPAHRTSTLAVLDVLTGPDAWETLRERYDIDDETAIRRVIDSIVLHLRAARA
ncbi:MAG: TetR/AcrR family transcriptional regulator [Actinomycetota bacterium]|nr:TetR/AcrR family transcriptional regulator [Actinomycetota bacterium]